MNAGGTTRNRLGLLAALGAISLFLGSLAGSASASHEPLGDPNTIELTPQTDSAVVGECNEFVITSSFVAHAGAPPVATSGETIDVIATQADTDTIPDNTIAFCDPDGGEAAVAPRMTPTSAGPACDVDDKTPKPGIVTGNPPACDDPESATAGTESAAQIQGDCPVPTGSTTGVCEFGVTSDEAGTMAVTAFFDRDHDGSLDSGEPSDSSTKTWTGGSNQVRTLSCAPPQDTNPEGARHEFQCTARDASGAGVPGATVTFDVTAGPNAEEVAAAACPNVTNAQGQTTAPRTTPAPSPASPTQGACGYNDAVGANSPPGTDTIIAWVNQGTGTAGPDTGEPQATISKTWSSGAARTIDCEPETASKSSGESHTVTCTVRDSAANPVAGVDVVFTETGAGTIASQSNTSGSGGACRSSTTGVCTATVSTSTTETGEQTVKGEIEPAGSTTRECTRLANDPTGAPAGACSDSVTVNWMGASPSPSPTDTPLTGPCSAERAGDRTVFVGSDSNDEIRGTNGPDVICAGGGDDSVSGLGGDDLIYLGSGDDTADGGGGKDKIQAGGGIDLLTGGAKPDSLRGGNGSDELLGGGGGDSLRGGGGTDTLRGGGGKDKMNGEGGRDTCFGGNGRDRRRSCERGKG